MPYETAQGRGFVDIVMKQPLFPKLAAIMLVAAAYYKYIQIIFERTQDNQNCCDRAE
jgi:hypothetical protein